MTRIYKTPPERRTYQQRRRIRLLEAGLCIGCGQRASTAHRQHCRYCVRRKRRQEKLRGRNGKSRWRKVARRLLVLQERGGCCVDCGNDNPLVLDFDHIDPTSKCDKVSRHSTLEAMRVEAVKCVIRCANCHRIKTWLKTEMLATKFRELASAT